MNTIFSLNECRLCPRQCGTNRLAGGTGICGAGDTMRVAKVMLHKWEEPCISGTDTDRGSGAVFFAHCSLGCIYCQNKAISRRNSDIGQCLSPDMLADIFLSLQSDGAWNINLVSPTHYMPQIREAVQLAKAGGLHLPIIWNTGGYERPEVIEALADTVDIYLTDWKYNDPVLASSCSQAPDYPINTAAAFSAMYKTVGRTVFDNNGMLTRGIILRHLLLPGCRHDSMAILSQAAAIVPPSEILLSLMRQYTPEFLPDTAPKSLRRRITSFEYNSVMEFAAELGFSGYSQGADAASSLYAPDF